MDVIDLEREHRALLDLAAALARPITPERLAQELAAPLRRLIPLDALALIIADEATGELRVHGHAGWDGADATLADPWRESIATRRAIERRVDASVELTVPLTIGERVLGALSIRVEEVPARVASARRVLVEIAPHVAAGLERAAEVRQLAARQRLDATGEVAAGMAHELRNPLVGIASAAQLIRFRSRDDPVLERNVGRIVREVERLNGIATDLLAFGRREPLHLAPIDPDALWDEVLEANRGLLESRALVLERARLTPPVRVAADAAQLGQVFFNVLTNAVEAAPPASDLALRSTRLPTGAWRCALTNAGAALSDDALRRAFDLFYTTRSGGTGMGLPLCRRIIDSHHGTIALERAAGGGTTLTITLRPLAG